MTRAETKRSLIRTLELHAAVLAEAPGDGMACIHMGRARWWIYESEAAHERMAKNFKRLKLSSILPWTYHENAG